MKDRESVEKVFDRFGKVIGKLKGAEKTYFIIDQITRILNSLSPQWFSKIMALESMNLNKMTYDKVRGDLITLEKAHLLGSTVR